MTSSQEVEAEGLRKRNVSVQRMSEDEARQTVLKLNALEEKTGKSEKDKKMFGRTPGGTVFTVPFTHDMVTQLLSPSEPKNVSDILVILVLLLHIFLFWALPQPIRVPILGATFLTWRAGYNIGIGWLLQLQSHQQTLVRWASKSKLFGRPEETNNPKLRAFIKRELEIKIPTDYNFDTAPLEYNTWLVFRRIVDLILMCDFTSYILFAFACGRRPEGESIIGTAMRWSVGIILFLFNLWVKLDAHRVVKDFAWYWGDFFYLIDQELTFDGVFEMAPHPMYSIGYVGYYGISLMAASYKVLFVSIVAHAAQFAFLVWVESPHIDRTYNSPPPRRQINDPPKAAAETRPHVTRMDTAEIWPNPVEQPSATHNLLGLSNMDLYRTTDSSVLIVSLLMLTLTILTPCTPSYQTLFVANAAFWRLWFSLGIGYLLNRQSVKKKWTRHFVKYGESTGEAWRQWKGTYHLSMVLCYTSYGAAAWKMYTSPEDWSYELILLKHTMGIGLVALQIWVSFSIYESLGEFGWFFGDFFFDHSPKLTYSGIYRFLNNPERVLGLAGVWGVALITSSKSIFSLALLSHTLSLAFIQLVERPHMQKLYGRNLRQDAGLVRSLRRSLPPPFRQWQDGMDKVLGETIDKVEDFLDAAKPKLAAGVDNLIQDTKSILQKYPGRLTVTLVESEIVGLHPEEYEIEVEGESIDLVSDEDYASENSNRPPTPSVRNTNYTPLRFEYGAPLKVRWTAPLKHGKRDWIGLYMVADNDSRQITRVASFGRWIATNPGEYDTRSAELGIITSGTKTVRKTTTGQSVECMIGEMEFSGDKLWWVQGSFEFRYHHNGKHNVMAISLPFEVRIPRFTEDDLELPYPSPAHLNPATSTQSVRSAQNDSVVRASIENILLPVVQNCFDRDPNIAPRTPQETFGGLVERDGKYSRRVVYAIRQMFGIEFAGEVVKADGKVENLAWRIWEAKKVLAPYSMSRSRGTSTPIEEEREDEKTNERKISIEL